MSLTVIDMKIYHFVQWSVKRISVTWSRNNSRKQVKKQLLIVFKTHQFDLNGSVINTFVLEFHGQLNQSPTPKINHQNASSKSIRNSIHHNYRSLYRPNSSNDQKL